MRYLTNNKEYLRYDQALVVRLADAIGKSGGRRAGI